MTTTHHSEHLLDRVAMATGRPGPARSAGVSALRRSCRLAPGQDARGRGRRLLDASVRYGERLEQEGGTIQLRTWQGMIHVFTSNVALLKAARAALDDIGDFLKRQLLGDPVAVVAETRAT
jgi:acetyl esterase/lipase